MKEAKTKLNFEIVKQPSSPPWSSCRSHTRKKHRLNAPRFSSWARCTHDEDAGNLQVHRIVIKPSYCVQRVDDYLIVSVLWHSKRENLQAAELTLCRKFIAHISFFFVCDKIVKVNDLKFFQLRESCFCSFPIRSEIWVVRAHAELCSALLRTTRSSLNRLICWLFFNFYAIINIIGVLTKREAFFRFSLSSAFIPAG